MPSTGIKGVDFLLKVGDGATPTEAFATIAQARVTNLVINNSEVDITNKDSGQVRELLTSASTKSYSITIDGIFDDGAAQETFRALAESADPAGNMELIDGTGDKYEGKWQISQYGLDSNQESALAYNAQLSSAGAVTRGAV